MVLAPLWKRLGYVPELVVQRKLRDPQVILDEFRQEQQKKDQTRMQQIKQEREAQEKAQGMSAAAARTGVSKSKPLASKQNLSIRTFCLEGVECFRHNRIASKARENRFVIGWQGRQSLLQYGSPRTLCSCNTDPARFRWQSASYNRSQRNSIVMESPVCLSAPSSTG